MPKNSNAKRSLSAQEVIDLVQSVDIPVLRMEKEIGIPVSVLQRALKPDTQKPLPVKYEQPLVEYVNQRLAKTKSLEIKKEVVLAKTGKEAYQPETTASEEEMASKRSWLDNIRAAKVIALFSK